MKQPNAFTLRMAKEFGMRAKKEGYTKIIQDSDFLLLLSKCGDAAIYLMDAYNEGYNLKIEDEGYAVVDRWLNIRLSTISNFQNLTKEKAEQAIGYNWETLMKKGYKMVGVTVKAVTLPYSL